jgi:hypothetical protein
MTTWGWDQEAEARWEWDAGSVGVGESYQDGGTRFRREKLCGGGLEWREQAAGGVERSCEEDGVEALGFRGETVRCFGLDGPTSGIGVLIRVDGGDGGVKAEGLGRDRGDEPVDQRAET